MLKKLQKKSLFIRKKILIIAVSTIIALILPFWILNFQRTIGGKSAKTNLTEQDAQTIQNLTEFKKEFENSLKEFNVMIDQVQNLTQAEKNQKLINPDPAELPKSENKNTP